MTSGIAVLAGLLCLVVAGVAPGGLAWVILWVSLVAAAAWFYVADRNGWRAGVTLGGQTGIVSAGLAVTVSLVVGSGWVLLLGLLVAGIPVALLLSMSDESGGSDLGGPVD